MNTSNRAAPPAPINPRASTGSASFDQSRTGYFDSPTGSMEKPRSSSYSSVGSNPESPCPPHKSHSWVKPSPTVNVYTTCGRHTDQLLFGGPSLVELARSVLKRH